MKKNFHDQLDQVWSVIKIREDNDMIDSIVWSMLKSKLKCQDLSNRVRSVMKTRHDNNVIGHTRVWSTPNSKLSYHDQSDRVQFLMKTRKTMTWSLYKCVLCWKWSWAVIIDQTGYDLWWKWDRTTTWLIVQLCSTLKTMLNYQNWSD